MTFWSGSVRSKLILPILATTLALVGYLYGILLPEELHHEERDHLELVDRHLKSVAEGLFPLMVSEQLDTIHENLGVLEKQNPNWVSLRLENREGKQLYPLLLGQKAQSHPVSEHVRKVRLPIHSQDVLLGWLEIQKDLGPTVETIRTKYARLAGMFGGLALVLIIVVTVTVEAAVTRPLRQVAAAACKLARQEFDTRLPDVSPDEVGSLVESFSAMREDLRAYQHNLETEIAEHQRAKAALQELNATLETRVHEEVENNRNKDHLLIQQSRLATMGEMMHNVAHHWRQPLSGMMMILQNIEDDFQYGQLTAGSLKEQVQRGVQLAQQMSDTIDSFRNFFQSDQAETRFSLGDAVRNALRLVDAGYRNHQIEVAVETEGEVFVTGYANEFSQALLNVLDNAKDATKAAKAAGKVTIQIGSLPGYGVIRVCDNGGGIADAALPKIFDPYFTTREGGVGIGLYMSRMILEHMRGYIEARNVAGGAEFLIAVPTA
jgi:C4-dicarboxylate-specific signal transduction histidine kinase